MRPRSLRVVHAVTRGLLFACAAVLLLVVAGMLVLETSWAKNQLRALIVRQANEFLTATVEIGSLQGSIFRGLELADVRLSRDGETIISVDDVALDYSIRELVQPGVIVRRIVLVRPRVLVARQSDGRWNLGALVKRETTREQQTGPGRPIHLLSIEVLDGAVTLRDPYTLGAAHVPSQFDKLNLTLGFDYEPVTWRLNIQNASWIAPPPDLSMNRLTGILEHGGGGWSFTNMRVQTPEGDLTVSGRVLQGEAPTRMELDVRADRFTFPEWGGVIRGLRNIAIDSSFNARMSGPLKALVTDIDLRSNGGNVRGALTLDTTVPGWHGNGSLSIARLDLAPWLNRPDRKSDITGDVTIDMALELGRHFPRGSYRFAGPHAEYLGYAGDAVRAQGEITETDVRIASGQARAYGSTVRLGEGSTISLDAPFPYRFVGTADGVDLRLVPEAVPVPHVESRLTVDYDVNGQFVAPFLKGDVKFGESEFLGAAIGAGTIGSIDTSAPPVRYSGEGDVRHLDMNRFGMGLGARWLQDPRFAGTLDGHFRVTGAGGEPATMTLAGGGHLTRAQIFGGTLADAEVSVDIAGGSLEGSYDGSFANIFPERAFADPRFAAQLTGSGRARVTVRDLLVRTPTLPDYTVDASLTLDRSVIRDVPIDKGAVDAVLSNSAIIVTQGRVTGPSLDANGSGRLELDAESSSDFAYDVARGDLALVKQLLGRDISGDIATTGRVTGPSDALHLVGEATVSRLDTSGVKALSTSGHYDVTMPLNEPGRAAVQAMGRASFVEAFGRSLDEASGTVMYEGNRLDVDLQLMKQPGPNGALTGAFLLDPEAKRLEVASLAVDLGRAGWRLVNTATRPVVTWDDEGITVTSLVFASTASADQQISISGQWREDPASALHVTATHVFLDTIAGALDRPARYGGVVDADAMIRRSEAGPLLTGTFTVSEGRVQRISYQKLAVKVDYANGVFQIDGRLDQSPGVWVTAAGSVPLGMLDRSEPDGEIKLTVRSSTIALGLIEGVTDVVREVSGNLQVNLDVVGTGRDPHFAGTVQIAQAGFVTPTTGARYKNGMATLQLTADRVTVSTFHLEDRNGRTLDVSGSLGTHELTVGDLEITAVTRRFEVMRNEAGSLEIDANVMLTGRFEQPLLQGDVTITGGSLRVDEILSRALFRPYAMEATSPPTAILPAQVDALARLNPWERLSLALTLHSPGTLRMEGDNVQVTDRAPLGLGSFNLRATGDLYLYKGPGSPLIVNGWFDSLSGSYAFQGRRFDVDPASSVRFQGDLNPEVYVSVTRVISSVEVRVSINGLLTEPELRFASNPPLESSDILSLIVFNTSANQLSAAQQQELAVRAGTLAAGFVATPLLAAIERTLGLESLEIEPSGDFGTGPKVTVGEEILPGLIARFSRQFGGSEYDEATIEYYLSRILRLRATFSDAGDTIARSPFRRVERAGVDLLLLFSF